MFGPKRAGRTLRLFWRIRQRMRAVSARCRSEQMHRVRRPQSDRHEGDAEHAKTAGEKVSAIMPVMTVADASTMPIWYAADATS